MPKWYHNVLSKIWVTLEVVQTLQYILLPLIIPVFYKNAYFTLSVTSALMAFSLFIVIMFNLLHLGRKNDARVDWIPVLVFVPYIILCYATNFLSHIWAILHYGIYYSKKRLRITKIPEVMSIVSGGIDNITKTFHRTMVHAEQKSIHGVVHTPDTDSIMQSPRALPRQNEFISCISSTRPLRGPHEMNSFHYPSPQHRNYKLKPKSKTYVRRPGNVYTKSGPFSNTVIIRPGQEIRIMDI